MLRQASSPMVLLPAYGRQYKTKEAAIQDWKDGKDFKIQGGPYCSIRDTERLVSDSSSVFIRYFVDDMVRVL